MINMQMEQQEDYISPRVSIRRNGSLACPHPSLFIDSLSRKSFSYNKLPEQPLTLTVIKLDGTSFVIEVPKTGTVAQLKQGVEAAFSHLPKQGPGTVSWSHVWGHFCLSYHGQKLLTDSDHIGSYGIQDGEQLHFLRHVSISYNMVKEKQEEEGPHLDKPIMSDGCKDRQENEEEDDNDNERDIEKQQDNYDNDEEWQGVMTHCQYKLAHLFRRWFSYHKLATSDMRMEEKVYSPRSSFGSLGSFKNDVWLSSDKYDQETWKAK